MSHRTESNSLSATSPCTYTRFPALLILPPDTISIRLEHINKQVLDFPGQLTSSPYAADPFFYSAARGTDESNVADFLILFCHIATVSQLSQVE